MVCDNVFGIIEEDVECCDFIFNVMYYSVVDFIVKDFVGGLEVIEKCEVRLIGDFEVRYCEDLVRMFCVVRFVVKLFMFIYLDIVIFIKKFVSLLMNILLVCLFEEIFKFFFLGKGEVIFLMLCEYGLIVLLFL